MQAAKLDEHLMTFHIAYRELIAGPDKILEAHGLGRAHHRVLFVLSRTPGLTVGDLCDQLSVTAQALNKTLRPLLAGEMVGFFKSNEDARVKRLQLTSAGNRLERSVTGMQLKVFERARHRLGGPTLEAWAKFMRVLAEEAIQDRGTPNL
jgi:DNA-binding MarR family transcriptional regulator